MELTKGNKIWIPCQVKPGPFSDERSIMISSVAGESIVFVRTEYLKDPIVEGETFVRANVIDIDNGYYTARLPGYPINSNLYRGELEKVGG